MDLQIRNRKIYEMRLKGVKLKEIGEAFDMSAGRAGIICREMAALAKERPVPDGLSLKTAKAIEWAFGIWPSAETAEEIADRKDEWLRAHGIGRKQYLEIEAWVASQYPSPYGE